MGTGHITRALLAIREGNGSESELDEIEERLRIVADANRCYLPVQEHNLISSILRLFPDDVAAHLAGSCPAGKRTIPTPKVVDLVDGVVTYDQRQELKRPDWTYG